MESVSGYGVSVLPWHVVREDGEGHRYRVASYATRTEARQVAERLAGSDGPVSGVAGGDARYLVEPVECVSGEYA